MSGKLGCQVLSLYQHLPPSFPGEDQLGSLSFEVDRPSNCSVKYFSHECSCVTIIKWEIEVNTWTWINTLGAVGAILSAPPPTWPPQAPPSNTKHKLVNKHNSACRETSAIHMYINYRFLI